MNWRLSLYFTSILVMLEGAAIVLSAFPGFLCKDPFPECMRLAFSGGITILAGSAGMLLTRSQRRKNNPGLREGFGAVAFTWIFCTLFGALPYFMAGFFPADAVFESASGITTTGATIAAPGLKLWTGGKLQNGVESMSYGLLFWRSLSQWIGGGGIVVFSLAVLPFFRIGEQTLYNAEVPGVKNNHDQLTPRVATTAKIMFGVYLALTLILAFLLRITGMGIFDAVCHAMTTIATGGFSTKNGSIAFYNNAYIEYVLVFFMFLSGCSFLLFYRSLIRLNPKDFFSAEHKMFTFIVLFSTAVITVMLMLYGIETSSVSRTFVPFPKAFRQTLFQVVSIITTTGFSTSDYAFWPEGTWMVILVLMFSGACTGSTSGGFKIVRLLILAKTAVKELKHSLFPRSVGIIKLDGRRVEDEAVHNTVAFFIIFFAVMILCALILPFLCKMDFLTAFSASVSAISNVGPGFGQITPSGTFAWMNVPAKLLLSLEMIAGRLELYTILVLFIPSFWKK